MKDKTASRETPSEWKKNPTKHIPQSRLYWEIKAEQTLNKIFDQSRVIDDSAASKPFTDVEVINFAPNDEKYLRKAISKVNRM